MRYHFTPIRMAINFFFLSVGEDVEKLEHWCLAGGNVKWCSPCGKPVKLKQNYRMIQQFHSQVNTQRMGSRDSDPCTPVLTATPLAIPERWKQVMLTHR